MNECTNEVAEAACEILELIRNASNQQLSPQEEYLLVNQVWTILCEKPKSDFDSRLQVCPNLLMNIYF